MQIHRLITLLLLLSGYNQVVAQTPTIVSKTSQPNSVKFTANSNGALFTDGLAGQFIPMQPDLHPKTLLRSAGIWIMGIDPGGNLHGAIQTNHHSDFSPGILDDQGLPVTDLNNVWEVSCTDINQLLGDLNDNGLIDNPNTAINKFPGRGNPLFAAYNDGKNLPNNSFGLGGFYDTNEDGYYDPTYGNYPSIDLRGCPADRYPTQQLWSVSQDVSAHFADYSPIGMEVQTQIFAYKTAATSPLNNTIYVRYKLINRATQQLDSCFVGLFSDFDLGGPNDDFMGIDTSNNLVFAYNGDANDENGFGLNMPIVGADLLRGPLTELGQDVPLKYSMVLNNVEDLPALQYYNVLNGRFPNGTAAPNNGLMYPGDLGDLNGVSEITAGNTPGSRVSVVSYGPFTLLPGAVNELVVAYYYSYLPNATPAVQMQAFRNGSSQIQGLFDNCFGGFNDACSAVVKAPEVPKNEDLILFPNPADGQFSIESKGEPFGNIRISDLLGRTVRSIALVKRVQIYTVSTTDLPAGLYRLTVDGAVLSVAIQH